MVRRAAELLLTIALSLLALAAAWYLFAAGWSICSLSVERGRRCRADANAAAAPATPRAAPDALELHFGVEADKLAP